MHLSAGRLASQLPYIKFLKFVNQKESAPEIMITFVQGLAEMYKVLDTRVQWKYLL